MSSYVAGLRYKTVRWLFLVTWEKWEVTLERDVFRTFLTIDAIVIKIIKLFRQRKVFASTIESKVQVKVSESETGLPLVQIEYMQQNA